MTDTVLAALKARIAKLEATIQDKDAREYFLRLPKSWLDDVERKVAPGIEKTMLPIIDQMLTNAEGLVAKYGPTIRVIGG